MKNVIELLEKHYSSFIDQERYWNFFLGLSDYIVLVRETPETKEIIEMVMSTKSEDLQRIQKLHNKTVKEFKQSKEKVLKIIKDNKISSVELDKAIKELESYEDGSLLTSRSKPRMYDHCLFEIALNLPNDRRKDLLKDFIDNSRGLRNIYGNFVFSKTFFELSREAERLEEKRKVTLWHAWDRLSLIYSVLHEREKITAELRNDKSQFWAVAEFNWFEMISEMNRIEESTRSAFDEQRKFYHFKKDEYRLYATRIHNHLIKELSNSKTKKLEPKEIKERMSFDTEKSVLIIHDKKIRIKKFSDQYNLLKIILEDKKRLFQELFFSEIAEIYDPANPLPDKKFYNATYQVNQKIIRDTGIQDFLIMTTQSVKFNEKYLR